MSSRRAVVAGVKVPFLSEEAIEAEAGRLWAELEQARGGLVEPPVPIEDLIEKYLGFTLEFDDVRTLGGHDDVLGGTSPHERLVVIDQTLDPEEHPEQEGRYRFTLGHEAGHDRLHKRYAPGNPQQPMLPIETRRLPAILCRTSMAKKPIEWQANQFSSCLLMPPRLVTDAWYSHFGDTDPRGCRQDDLTSLRSRGYDLPDEDLTNIVLGWVAREFASVFNVSTQAMRIRLERMGLLKRELYADLFSAGAAK